MSIPVLASGVTPPVDWLARRMGMPKYLDPCTVPRWGDAYNLGAAYCRKIAGSSSWSNHAFGNALDIGIKPDDSPLGDEIAAWLRGPEVTKVLEAHGYSIAHLLWKVADHHNHIHVDFNPYGTGTPPCAGGPAGKVVQPWPLNEPEEDDEMSKEYEDAQVNRAIGQANGYGYDKMKANGFKGAALPPGSKALTDNPEKYAGFWYALGKLEATKP